MAEDYDDLAYMDEEDEDRISRAVMWVSIVLVISVPLIGGLAIYGAVRLIWG